MRSLFPRFFILTATVAAGLWSVPAQATVAWKQKTIQVKVDASQEVVEAHFAFTNKGKSPVDITKVESSCGCTTAELTQRHYEPGQSGEIIAKYTIGNHVGTQRKTVAVRTSGQEEPDILTIVADIPEMVRFTPAFVTWAKNDSPTPKKLILETSAGVTINEVEMKSSNPAMEARLETAVKGHRYEVTVTPSNTDHFVFATLVFDCRFGKEVTRTFRAYATVKPVSAAESESTDASAK